jgi:hypothetical protein
LVQPQLVGVLHRDQPLGRGDLGGQRAQERVLADVRAPADDHVFAGADQRPAELPQPGVDRAQAGELVEGGAQVPVPADRHGRAVADRHHREQPGSVGQLHGQPRAGPVEAPLFQPGAGRDRADQLDQLRVRGGHRADLFGAASGEADPHVVAAIGVDVLDLRVLQVRLEPGQLEQRVEHPPGRQRLGVAVEHRPARGQRRRGLGV